MSLNRCWSISMLAALFGALALAASAHASCAGDCDGDGQVTIGELVTAVNIALGTTPLDACEAASSDGTTVQINDLVADVESALTGCPASIVLNGICQRPGTQGQSLRPCDDGTPVEAERCLGSNTDFSACLQDVSSRVSIGGSAVAGAGHFTISAAAPPGADIVFDAMLQDAGDVVFPYRAHYHLPPLGAGLRLGTGVLATTADAPVVTIDPSSEGTLREVPLLAPGTLSSEQVDSVTGMVRSDPRAQYSGLSLACAATLGTGIAASYVSRIFQGDVLYEPHALAVDAAGNVYVAAEGGPGFAGSNNVFRITPAGEIQQIIDVTGDGAGHPLDGAYALTVDKAGNVFVAGGTGTMSNVFRITPGGVIQQIIDATGDGAGHSLFDPLALAVDNAGNVFVAGLDSNNVLRITPGGVIQQIIDITGDGVGHPLNFPVALAVDNAGNVFVASGGLQGTQNVFRITPGGVIQQIIDATGDGAGHSLVFPHALAVDDAGNVFVAGADSNNVFRITPTGAIQQIIDATGDGAGHPLHAPAALAVDNAGNVFVAGGNSSNVFRITPTGAIQQIIDATGDGAGHPLSDPAALAVDNAGNVFVAGQLSDNVFRITPGGVIQQIIDVTGGGAGHPLLYPDALAVDAAGNVFVAGESSDNVFRITPGGVVQQIIDARGDGAGHPLDLPVALAVDNAGNVFVAGGFEVGDLIVQGSDNVFRITPGGVIQQIIDVTGDGAGHPLGAASALAVDNAGNVYVAGGFEAGNSLVQDSEVFRITPGGVIQQIIDTTGDGAGNPLNGASALAVDNAGNVFVAGAYSYNVFRITPGGTIQQIIDGTGDGAGHPLDGVRALTVDNAGNVFVAGGTSNVFRITPGGVIQQIIDATGDGAGNPLNGVRALTVDNAGNVFVAGGTGTTSNVFRITPGGVIQQIIDATGDGAGHPLDAPSALAVDDAGNVLVASEDNNSVFKISPCGFSLSVTP